MQRYLSFPGEIIKSFWRNRELIFALSKRDILGRYQGAFFGVLWSFINPVLMLMVYTFVFGFIFKAQWQYGAETKTYFSLVLFSGLIIFNFFSECIAKSPNLIVQNANYVKKIVFPLEVLSLVSIISALFHAFISLIIWLLAYTLLISLPDPIIILLPLLCIPLILLTLGISWMLSAIGVYFRDLTQIIGALISVLMFLSPIFYPLSALPEQYRQIAKLNPMAINIEWARSLLFDGTVPSTSLFLTNLTFSFGIALLGWWIFQSSRRGFADVL